MIYMRETSTAYLMNGREILLMKRADNRSFAPGIWAGVGGHVEPGELNKPFETCVREIYEETGISIGQINHLRLQYIILRRSKTEIRIQYVYFGDSMVRNVVQTEEGQLFWIDKDRLFERKLSVTSRLSLEHYLAHGPTDEIMVGTVFCKNLKPVMNWCPVQDWEGI